MHQEKTNKHANEEGAPEGAVPAYLIDREGVSRAKVREWGRERGMDGEQWLEGYVWTAGNDDLSFFNPSLPPSLLPSLPPSLPLPYLQVLSNTVKQKRAERAGKWSVPLPKVKPVADDEMFRVMQSGKRKGTSATPSLPPARPPSLPSLSGLVTRIIINASCLPSLPLSLQPSHGSEW